jgi:beta-lactamase regulating signal transducer with metallopeptidase domain
MNPTDLEKRLKDLVTQITERNKVVQEKKQSGPGGWIVAVVLALVSLVGIGVAMYLASRRAKELAKAKTELEHSQVDLEEKVHKAKKEKHIGVRKELLKQYKKVEIELQKCKASLHAAEAIHAVRKKRIEKLKAWDDINEL